MWKHSENSLHPVIFDSLVNGHDRIPITPVDEKVRSATVPTVGRATLRRRSGYGAQDAVPAKEAAAARGASACAARGLPYRDRDAAGCFYGKK